MTYVSCEAVSTNLGDACPHVLVLAAVSADAVSSKVPLSDPGGEDVAAEPPGHAAQAVLGAQPAPRRLVG